MDGEGRVKEGGKEYGKGKVKKEEPGESFKKGERKRCRTWRRKRKSGTHLHG